MAKKFIVSTHGLTAEVDYTIIQMDNFLHVIEVVATCGGVVEKSRITIGAVDGPRLPPPTTAKLQDMLDVHRVLVANNAGWKEAVRLALGGIK